jgi:hypothetical protein
MNFTAILDKAICRVSNLLKQRNWIRRHVSFVVCKMLHCSCCLLTVSYDTDLLDAHTMIKPLLKHSVVCNCCITVCSTCLFENAVGWSSNADSGETLQSSSESGMASSAKTCPAKVLHARCAQRVLLPLRDLSADQPRRSTGRISWASTDKL